MVVAVGIAGDEIPVPVAFEFVAAELAVRLRGAASVDDDLPALQPLHPVFHAARPLDRRPRVQTETAVVRHALGFRAVTGDDAVLVSPPQQLPGGLGVGLTPDNELVDQEDRLPRRVIMQPDKGEGIRREAPVHAHIDPVELPDFLVADLPQLQMLKDVSAGPHRKAEILVLIRPLVAVPEALRLGDELLAQPFSRRLQIGASVAEPVRPLQVGIEVGPVVAAEGRVVALKVPEPLSAAHGRLENRADLRPPGELILLLKVRHRDAAEGDLDGLDLHRVVRAAEKDLLSRGPEYQLHRTEPAVEELLHAQLFQRPEILGIDRVPHGVGHLAQDQGVGLLPQQQEIHHRQRHEAALHAAAPARQVIVRVSVDQHVPQHRRKSRRDALSDPLRRRGQGKLPLAGGALFLMGFEEFDQAAARLQAVPDGDRFSAGLRERPAHHVAQEAEGLVFRGNPAGAGLRTLR